MLALSWCPAGKIPALLAATQTLTTRPFGVNLVLQWDQSRRVNLALEHGARIFSFFWGDPSPYIRPIHAQGGLVLCTVGSVDEARRATDVGCDALVVQGQEAGGHVRGEVATMVLVPAVADAVPNLPLVAAGGIADGRGLAAALCLGADAVWLGTRFLATRESRAHAAYKAAILAATENDTLYGTLFDGGWPGAPHRALVNSTVKTWRAAGSPPNGQRPGEGDFVGQLADGTRIPRYHEYPPDQDLATGDPEIMCLYAGQSVGLVHAIDAEAGALVESIDAQAHQILGGLGSPG
jgi:nitronate monooxygenase